TVIDATAGFGHDSLILASTGASVTLLEQQPLMFLLLQLEQQKMVQHRNWQKLMSRLTIYHGDAIALLAKLPKVDRVYLDPMFPADSYKSAVNKHMQMLHTVTTPPSIAQAQQL
ncbi:class I SAM-dependent methyltransferase, partial [Escherichia coli]